MKVEQLTATIGAELIGVNLADAVHDDGLFAEIRAQLLKHRVVFLRNQEISRADHVAFARRFGELEDHPVAGSDPEHPGLVRIYKNPDQPMDRYENAWHTDATWREAPPMGCVLRCVECPPVGGDTMWANMVEAYARLPEDVKLKIADLRARHSIEASFGAAMPIEKRLALKAMYPDAETVVPSGSTPANTMTASSGIGSGSAVLKVGSTPGSRVWLGVGLALDSAGSPPKQPVRPTPTSRAVTTQAAGRMRHSVISPPRHAGCAPFRVPGPNRLSMT